MLHWSVFFTGSYCVYQYGTSCPTGFGNGWIAWDDEDTYNVNKYNGILPAGIYDVNTNIKYCCDKSGQWYNAIKLPVDRPFYLLPRNSPGPNPNCQIIKWAMTSLEHITYDTENTQNRDKSVGDHVFYKKKHESALQMYYCYYQSKYLSLYMFKWVLT